MTISCVQNTGITEPSPGDEFRVVIVGYPKRLTAPLGGIEPREISAYVTGLNDISVTDCWNRETNDKRILKGTASDVMDCRGIDVGFGYPDFRNYPPKQNRVSIGFNGIVVDPLNPVTCPCFSRNRLDKFQLFSKANNSPECTNTVDPLTNNGYIQALFPTNTTLSSVNVLNSTNSLVTCCAVQNSGPTPLISDARYGLSEQQFNACKEIIRDYCQ